jgi:hypothetical protein
MSDLVDRPQLPSVELTAAEREWIRRQGVTARVLADEQRRTRERLSAMGPEVTRVRDELRRDRRRFGRTG